MGRLKSWLSIGISTLLFCVADCSTFYDNMNIHKKWLFLGMESKTKGFYNSDSEILDYTNVDIGALKLSNSDSVIRFNYQIIGRDIFVNNNLFGSINELTEHSLIIDNAHAKLRYISTEKISSTIDKSEIVALITNTNWDVQGMDDINSISFTNVLYSLIDTDLRFSFRECVVNQNTPSLWAIDSYQDIISLKIISLSKLQMRTFFLKEINNNQVEFLFENNKHVIFNKK